MTIRNDTPMEMHTVHGQTVYVKREDLCAVWPAPPFSKIRGLYVHLEKLKAAGTTTVAYLENGASMGAWAVAAVADALGMSSIIFDPQYKGEAPPLLALHRRMWRKFAPEVWPYQPTRLSIANNLCRQKLRTRPGAVLLPDGLPFPESVTETRREWRRTMKHIKPATTVLCIGSGTICAGILSAMKPDEGRLYGVLVSRQDRRQKRRAVEKKSGRLWGGLLGGKCPLRVIDAGWEYDAVPDIEAPFPCHPVYDLKAWDWLVRNVKELPAPVLFWNIGRQVSKKDLKKTD
jgi:hypothetical protein